MRTEVKMESISVYNDETDIMNQVLKSAVSNKMSGKNGKALILDAFGSGSYDKYETIQKQWEAMGLKTKLKDNIKISSFQKGLKGNSIIVFSAHGALYSYTNSKKKKVTVPALGTEEKATNKKDKQYTEELKKHRIARSSKDKGAVYNILPNFFTNTYKKKELKGSVVFMENCYGFGGEGGRNDALAKALNKSGAEFIIGFHNSVNGGYSLDILRMFVLNLMNGTTVGEALAESIRIYGENDELWRQKFAPNDPPEKLIAHPVWLGALDYRLWYGGILKGSFERQPDETEDATLQGWMKEGDVRVITRLGEILPVDGNYMAIITTGIGSAEDEYLNGESRSSLSQMFKIPEGTTTLAFSYNVVSEEPMEFIGTEYDDTFSAKIYDADGISFTEVARESVNTSSWKAVSGIDFAGGDSTAYQTGWKTIEIDVSSYGGQDVILSFDVWDEGDSSYDTAVLIDNVRLNGGN